VQKWIIASSLAIPSFASVQTKAASQLAGVILVSEIEAGKATGKTIPELPGLMTWE
jgi:hypothetical protein